MGVLTLGALCENGKECWLPSREYNALFYYDIEVDKFEYVNKFTNCINSKAWQIIKVLSWGDSLYCFSRYGYQCWKIDKKTKCFENIIYSKKQVEMISNVEIYKNMVFIMSNNVNVPILCWNIEKNDITEIITIINTLRILFLFSKSIPPFLVIFIWILFKDLK